MKKIIRKITLSLLFISVFTACNDDLNIEPQDELSQSEAEFFAQPDAYQRLVAGVYGNLSLTGTDGSGSSNIGGIDAGTSQYGRCLWYLQNLTTDEVIWTYENDPGTRDLNRNTWNATNPILRGMYGRAMFQVKLVNEFLAQSTPEKLDSRNVSAANRTLIAEYRNEVRVLRALAYYNLMDLFGKAAFVTENDEFNKPGPQYNRQQLFTYIESELNAVLPALKTPRTNEYGRLDKAFAWMILAKMYLNAETWIGQNRYQDCMNRCSDVIGGGYTLNSNYLNNFKKDNHTSSEMIFSIQSDGSLTQNYGPTTVIINGQVGSVEGNGNAFGVGGWGGALRVRKQFVQKFSGNQFNTDVRNTIISGSRPIDIVNVDVAGQGYVIAKWSNKSSTGVPGISSTFVDTDFPLFRLADAHLMYVEAQMRKDGATNFSNVKNATAQSITYLNALRARANGTTVSAGDVDLQFIIDERSRELYWEGHRRQDLIRFGRYTGGSYNWAWKGNIQNGTSIPENFNVFPIPQASLVANPNLSQNTGY
jgi:starch-binding outer membrane protein, SusD/RagB family